MSDLWRGTTATKARIASGLILFVYALLHFLNIGVGLIDPVWMDRMQEWRQLVTRSILGTIVIYGAFTVHIVFALARVVGRRSLRMPIGEMAQITMGLVIPILLITHIVHTRTAHEFYDVHDEMDYIMVLLHGTLDGWKQALLLLIVWGHGCIGLHFWLRGQAWWRASLPALAGCAVFVPSFALAGFLVEGRRVSITFAAPDTRQILMDRFNFPDWDSFQTLIFYSRVGLVFFAAIIGAIIVFIVVRAVIARHRSVTVYYTGGPTVAAAKGLTLLEMSRARGVPHASLCGGRGRCTTCRVVIEEGGEHLHPPSAVEAKSLSAVGAPPNTRLACQIRPVEATTVFRVFQPDGRRKHRDHASQGEERALALLFLDMRGFTARTTGQLPYDVVFLLNRFFDAVVPGVTRNGGKVDKYLGDGFLALFETPDAATSAKEALQAIEAIAKALATFNKTLESEGQSPVVIGIGAHLGDVVLGEIGAAGQAPRTLIGDTVNTASRLEGVTKEHKVQAFISAPLLIAAGYDLPKDEMIALTLRGLSMPLDALSVKEATGLSELLEAKCLVPA
jgi:adenylate cyclase